MLLILIDFVLKKDENYLNIVLKKKTPKIYIKEEFEISFDESDKEIFEKDSFNTQTPLALLMNKVF